MCPTRKIRLSKTLTLFVDDELVTSVLPVVASALSLRIGLGSGEIGVGMLLAVPLFLTGTFCSIGRSALLVNSGRRNYWEFCGGRRLFRMRHGDLREFSHMEVRRELDTYFSNQHLCLVTRIHIVQCAVRSLGGRSLMIHRIPVPGEDAILDWMKGLTQKRVVSSAILFAMTWR